MQNSEKAADPSMEDILASIRKIISEEPEGQAPLQQQPSAQVTQVAEHAPPPPRPVIPTAAAPTPSAPARHEPEDDLSDLLDAAPEPSPARPAAAQPIIPPPPAPAPRDRNVEPLFPTPAQDRSALEVGDDPFGIPVPTAEIGSASETAPPAVQPAEAIPSADLEEPVASLAAKPYAPGPEWDRPVTSEPATGEVTPSTRAPAPATAPTPARDTGFTLADRLRELNANASADRAREPRIRPAPSQEEPLSPVAKSAAEPDQHEEPVASPARTLFPFPATPTPEPSPPAEMVAKTSIAADPLAHFHETPARPASFDSELASSAFDQTSDVTSKALASEADSDNTDLVGEFTRAGDAVAGETGVKDDASFPAVDELEARTDTPERPMLVPAIEPAVETVAATPAARPDIPDWASEREPESATDADEPTIPDDAPTSGPAGAAAPVGALAAVGAAAPVPAKPAAAELGALAAVGGASGVRTLEDTVTELLRPMLRNWLDENMPRIVEKALRVELAERGLTPSAGTDDRDA